MQGWWRIAWSFYAAAMGSWALFSPGSYAYYAGILGLAMYAFASGTFRRRYCMLRPAAAPFVRTAELPHACFGLCAALCSVHDDQLAGCALSIMLTFDVGLPIILVAFLGGAIHRLIPNICSFTDYSYRRFGPIVQVGLLSAVCQKDFWETIPHRRLVMFSLCFAYYHGVLCRLSFAAA